MNTELSTIKFENVQHIYFLGIGGIGMSALARYFLFMGKAGYDKTKTPLTQDLQDLGIDIHYGDLGENIPLPYSDMDTTLIVYTPAIPDTLGEWRYFKSHGFRIVKRSFLLGILSTQTRALCVAGTHGKTTTSALLSHILTQSDLACTAFIGGIASNYNTNLLINTKADYTVIEADEFDRSFLQLSPFASIVTSIDPDHLDIYATKNEFQHSFEQFAQLISSQGVLVQRYGLNLLSPARSISYAIGEKKADYWAENIRIEQGYYLFDLQTPTARWENIELGMLGLHNIENALGCIALCDQIGIEKTTILSGLQTFLGVKRRMEIVVKTDRLIYIDDYAHHPTAIQHLIESLRFIYPNNPITAVFQPHLFSRTRDFFDDFARVLSQVDELILMPIYPAREKEIEGITSDALLTEIKTAKKQVLQPHEIIAYLSQKKEGLFVTIGAGDIDRLVEPLKNVWSV